MSDDEIVMYLIARKDLKMSPGKLAAQVGHGVQYILDRVRHSEETAAWHADWAKRSSTKIVLSVESREDFFKVMESIPFPVSLVVDEGRTEVAHQTETVLALLPVPKSHARPYVGHLPLYR